MVAVLGLAGPAVANVDSARSSVNALHVASTFTWIHSDATTNPATHHGEVYPGDNVTPICYVHGDSVGGNPWWDMVLVNDPDVNHIFVGFISEVYNDRDATDPCGDAFPRISTQPAGTAIWQHAGPGLNYDHVGDVGFTNGLRVYGGYFAGDLIDGHRSWYIVFDPMPLGRVGFIHCSNTNLTCLS
jgi:hypothetical protein